MKNSFSIEEIYRLFEQKKIDFCPNMFICGSSEVARETAALRGPVNSFAQIHFPA